LPSIIVLDLERNGKRCLKALERLKQNRRTRGIPVIGLAGPVINDLNGAYAAQVNCVVRKPATVEEAELFWTRIERFWFSAVTLPAVPRS
jgi:CheY-like chemotaxis protein